MSLEHPTAHVHAWEHTQVQDEVIDKVGLPFVPDLFQEGVPARVTEAILAKLDPTLVPLDLISPGHGRSYEVGNAAVPTAVWADQHANRYTSLSYKGNNFSNPSITRSLTAPSGFIPWGLQEDDALLRVIKSSRALREAGIPTEWIVGVMEPSVIPYESDLLSQHDYKKQLLMNALGKWNVQEVAEIAAALRPMTFFVTARCMEINDRPLDFTHDKSEDAVRNRLNKIFTVYNLTHNQDADYHELHAASNEDCRYYFAELLPGLQAKNLARLHRMGLVHKFPVPGNVTALGGIIDLDSVHGEPLGIGDAPITFADICRDIRMVFDEEHIPYFNVLNNVSKQLGWTQSKKLDVLHEMQQTFLHTYIAESGITPGSREAFVIFAEVQRSNEPLITSGRVYKALSQEFAGVFDDMGEFSEQISSFMAAARDRYKAMLPAYVTQVIDNFYDLFKPEVRTEDTTKEFYNRLCDTVLSAIENETLKETAAALAAGNAFPEFEALVQEWAVSEESREALTNFLSCALLAPHSVYYGRPIGDTYDIEYIHALGDVFDRTLAVMGEKRTLLLTTVEQEARAKGLEPEGRYQGLKFRVIRSLPLQDLMNSIAAEEADILARVRIYYDNEGSDSRPSDEVRAVAVGCYMTDAPLMSLDREITSEGLYLAKPVGVGEFSYVASISAADKDGIFHIIIKNQQPEG